MSAAASVALRAYMVEDEGPVRRELRHLLEQIEEVEVVGEAATGSTALGEIRELAPDLVFLDIHMPGLSGLELSKLLSLLPKMPVFVFITAFDEHAAEAFEVDAVDYLLKPVTLERLRQAVDKVKRRLGGRGAVTRDQAAAPPAELPPPVAVPVAQADQAAPGRKLPLYDGHRIVPTSPKHIMFVESAEGEHKVFTVHGVYSTKLSLAELEARLTPLGFFRAHRKTLVNLDHVVEIVPLASGGYRLFMSDPARSEVQVSRHQAKEFRQRFDL